MTQQSTSSQAASKPTHQIGGSFLPSSDPFILQPLQGQHGTFQVRPLPELDMYGLFIDDSLLAMHPNGYSCRELAERIVSAWSGKQGITRAMEQFDYILACGGLGMARGSIEYYARGKTHE